jgi:hypothetical protein
MIRVTQAEIVAWLKQYRGPRFHAVLGDVPYGLDFMDAGWDRFRSLAEYQRWMSEWAALMIEHLLYPGTVAMFFGGRKTFHRLAAGLEDAGFEIVDTMMWLYGNGWANSRKADREIAQVDSGAEADWLGWGTALKPCYEPVVVCRVPRPAGMTYADIALAYGTGMLWIDENRLPVDPGGLDDPRMGGMGDFSTHKAAKKVYAGGYAGVRIASSPLGRWPSNVAILHEPGCVQEELRWQCDPACVVRALDQQSGVLKSGLMQVGQKRKRSNGGYSGRFPKDKVTDNGTYGDRGGASRFFYQAKARPKERDAGCHNLYWKKDREKAILYSRISRLDWEGLTPEERARGNIHLTVKPIPMAIYLSRLMLPPVLEQPRRILIPFAGSGSEMIGAMQAGWDEIEGIEVAGEYCDISAHRLRYFAQDSQEISWNVWQWR